MARITCSELVERADLAAREGDAATLARVIRLLASRMGDPINDRLRTLARTCDTNGWPVLRKAVLDRIAIAGT